LVMSIMFSIPIFDVNTYLEGEVSYNNGLSLVQMYLYSLTLIGLKMTHQHI